MSIEQIDKYVNQMRQNGTFGEGIALSAAARCYNRPIVIFSPDARSTVQRVDLPSDGDADVNSPIYLGLFAEHYVSVKLCGPDTDEPHSEPADSPCLTRDAGIVNESHITSTADKNSEASVAESEKVSDNSIVHFHKNGRHYVYCKICTRHADIVRIHSHKGKMPAIASESGTIFRKEIVSDHQKSIVHIEAQKCARLHSLDKVQVTQQALMDKLISRRKEAVANKVGKLMITVYNDAKRLTLSANSWPSRVAASQKSQKFKYNDTDNEKNDELDEAFDLQYVTPANHHEFMACIVEAHCREVFENLLNARALSIRLDGSVDRTQIDKMYVLAKVINLSGDAEQMFLGVAEPQTRGAVGVLDAVKQGLRFSFGENATVLLELASSIVTDGASVNVGEKAGVWNLLQNERSKSSASSDVKKPAPAPLLKVWCAVYRCQLAWQSVSNTVVEVKFCFQSLASISSFFHSSAVRTREVKKLATERNIVYVNLPSVF